MRAYFSRQMPLKPIALGTATTVLFVGMIIGLRSLGLGYKSMPISGSLAIILLILILSISVKFEVKEMKFTPIVTTLIKSLAAASLMGLVAYGLGKILPSGLHKIPLSLAFLFILLLCAAIYTSLGRLLKMEEVETVDRGLDRFKAKFKKAPSVN